MVCFQANRVLAAAVTICLSGSIAARLPAIEGDWWCGFENQGFDGATVWDVAVFSDALIAAGSFTQAGGVAASRVACWTGSTWEPLGEGLNSTAVAACIYDSCLIVGGEFWLAGGMPAPYIARWNGQAWSSVGGLMATPAVYALTVYQGKLIAAGCFTWIGGVQANRIAAWDGLQWTPLGEGVGEPGSSDVVYALGIYQDKLVAAGGFLGAGNLAAENIATWNGQDWEELYRGVEGTVYAVCGVGGSLYVGGLFARASATPAVNIARWDGNQWHAVGGGVSHAGPVRCLTELDGSLIVGGDFWTAGGQPAAGIAAWDGVAWSALGSGLGGSADALHPAGSVLFVGGAFGSAGDCVSEGIARWEGTLTAAEPIPGSGPEGLDLSTFPNPTRGALSLRVGSPRGMTAQLVVHDAQGRAVLARELALAPGSNLHTLELGVLPTGVYFARVVPQRGSPICARILRIR